MRAALLLFTLSACCPPATGQSKPEPKYKGKPLAYWVERLQKAEADKDQAAAGRAIQAFGPDAAPAIPALVEMLDDRSPEFCNMVAGVLCALGPDAKSAVPELVKQLKEKRARSPQLVMEILGFIGPDAKEAVPLLLKAVEGPALREVALESLCKIGPGAKEAIPAIRRSALEAVAAKEKDPKASPFFLDELHKLGPDVVPILLDILATRGPEARSLAFAQLGKLGPKAAKAAPQVAALLKDESAEVRLDAAILLWKIEMNVSVVPVLAGLIKEEDGNVPWVAARVLGEIGAPARAALPALKAALTHKNTNVQNAAKRAIEKIEAADPAKN